MTSSVCRVAGAHAKSVATWRCVDIHPRKDTQRSFQRLLSRARSGHTQKIGPGEWEWWAAVSKTTLGERRCGFAPKNGCRGAYRRK